MAQMRNLPSEILHIYYHAKPLSNYVQILAVSTNTFGIELIFRVLYELAYGRNISEECAGN